MTSMRRDAKIVDFPEDYAFRGGELLDTGPGFDYPPKTAPHVRRLTEAGATWIRLGARTPVNDIR